MGVRYLRRTPRPLGKRKAAPGFANPSTNAPAESGAEGYVASGESRVTAVALTCFDSGTAPQETTDKSVSCDEGPARVALESAALSGRPR